MGGNLKVFMQVNIRLQKNNGPVILYSGDRIMKKFLVRKTIKFVKTGLVISDIHEAASEAEAQKSVSGWIKGHTYGGGWLGPEYVLCAVDYVVEE